MKHIKVFISAFCLLAVLGVGLTVIPFEISKAQPPGFCRCEYGPDDWWTKDYNNPGSCLSPCEE